MREPAGIFFLVNQDIVGLLCPQAMTPDLHRAVVVVEFYVKEAVGVLAPHHGAVGFLDYVVEVGLGRPVAHASGKIFRALEIGTPGLQPVIRRMPRAAELEIFMALRKLVAVEHDLGVAAVARHAAEQFVLAALAEFAHIGIRTIRRGHAGIVFLDPPAHLRDQLFLQGRGVAEQALGVGIFRFEIGSDIAVEDGGIAQHFLPVLVLQPGIIIDDRDAMAGERMRPARRDRPGQGVFCLYRLRHCHKTPRSHQRIRPPPPCHIGSI